MMSIIFGWINFAILLGLGRYAYKRFLQSPIKKIIEKEDNDVLALRADASSLENHVVEVVMELKVQEQKAVELIEKVKLWQKSFEESQKENLDTVEKNQKSIDENNEIRSNNLAIKITRDKLLSLALVDVRGQLEKKFSKDGSASDFLDQVCNNLNSGKAAAHE